MRQLSLVRRPLGDVVAVFAEHIAEAEFAGRELLVDLEEGVVVPHFKLSML